MLVKMDKYIPGRFSGVFVCMIGRIYYLVWSSVIVVPDFLRASMIRVSSLLVL